MAFELVTISFDQLNKLLNREEGQYLDFKSKRITAAKLSRTLSGFANADGGELLIGIEDNGDGNFAWDGFESVEEANGLAQAFEKLFPVGEFSKCQFLRCDGAKGVVVQWELLKSKNIHPATDDIFYLRRGAQNLPQKTRDEIRRIEYNKGLASFEEEKVGDEIKNIANSAVVIEFLINVVPTAEPEEWLRKQRLIRDETPTVAGEVLFSDEPQIVLPKTNIKIYRYKTSEQGTRDTLDGQPLTIEGCAYNQIANAVTKTIEVAEAIPGLGQAGFERIEYPREALHEIITNAVLHRDYSINDDVHVRIFDNRIEVQSPGLLPGHVTERNILKERFARNATIVRLINKFPNPPNKDVGEGLNTAFEAMRKLRFKDPKIEQTESSVLITLRHERLAGPEEIIMEYLGENDEINNSTAREICHEGSENKIKRVFERMMKSNLIERIPERKGKATAYRKATFAIGRINSSDES